MLLAIDVGNSHTVVGLYDGSSLVDHWRIATVAGRTDDELGVLLHGLFAVRGDTPSSVDSAILASVVPPLTDTLVRTIQRFFHTRCRVVGPGLKTGMPILYENPREVGADRIVNAVAAYDRVGAGCIVVDFGTATTFDLVTARGEYAGGAICPGIGISSEALFQRAARLPRVEFVRPKSVVGRNTVHSIQAGLVYGYVGLVDGIVRRMQDEAEAPCRVFATGGLAPVIGAESQTIDEVDELLTLEGLRILHERNVR